MHLWPVEHFFPHSLTAFAVQKQSKSEEISVQLAKGAFIVNDFLRNPHFNGTVFEIVFFVCFHISLNRKRN